MHEKSFAKVHEILGKSFAKVHEMREKSFVKVRIAIFVILKIE